MAEKLKCSFDASCTWTSTTDEDSPKAMQEYTEHFVRDHGAARARDRPKPKPIDRPTVDMGCSPADYNDFVRRWNQYKKDTGLPSDQVNGQLIGCLSAELESNFASANFDVSTMTEVDILAEMKTFAVAQVAIGTRRAEVMTATLGRIPSFCRRVKFLVIKLVSYITQCYIDQPEVRCSRKPMSILQFFF